MTDPSSPSNRGAPRPLVWITAGILTILLLWVLRSSAAVAVPIVFALFIALILAPIDRSLAKRLPRPLAWLSRLAVMSMLLLTLAVFFGALVYSAQEVAEEIPRVAETLRQFTPEDMAAFDRLQDLVDEDVRDTQVAAGPGTAENAGAEIFPDLRQTLNAAASTAGSWLVESASGLARRVIGAVGTFIAATVIVVFMVMLTLSETETWRLKIAELWPEGSSDSAHALRAISRKLRGFLLIRAMMGGLTAVLYVAWLWAFDIALLPVWAILTVLLGFIPNLGSVISGILPTLYALVTKDLETALIVGAGLFAIEQLIGNWIDPRLQGRQISISPIVVLISILVWGYVWGAAGALLAVPIMVGLMVSFAHLPALAPLSLLLSNQTDEAAWRRSVEL